MTASSLPLLRFGVVADPQYADIPMTLNRYYSRSADKLAAAVDYFNAQPDLQFVVSLGDAIDRHWESYDAILAVYRRLRAPVRFVLGNHDFLVDAERLAQVPGRLGLERAYYDFAAAGLRFVVVDGNHVSIHASVPGSAGRALAESVIDAMTARGEPNAHRWNGGLGEAQYHWLAETLGRATAAGEKIVVFGHFPVLPFTDHSLWDSGRFVDLLTSHDGVLAYFNGHDHRGNYGEHRGRHFVNFRGMVETEHDTAYARVDVFADRIEIIGQGTEPSRVLPLHAPIGG